MFRTRRARHIAHPPPAIPTLPRASTSRASATTTPISPRVGTSALVPPDVPDGDRLTSDAGFRVATVAPVGNTRVPGTLTGMVVDSTTAGVVASSVAVSVAVTAAAAVAEGVIVGVEAEYTSVAVAEPAAVGVPVARATGVAGGRESGAVERFTRVGRVFPGVTAGRAGVGTIGCGGTGSGSGVERRADGVTVAGGVLVGGCLGVAGTGVAATVARGTMMPCVAPLPAGVFVAAVKGGVLRMGVFVTGANGDAPE